MRLTRFSSGVVQLVALTLTLTLGLFVAAPVRADVWTMDPDASRLGFVATQSGAPVEGVFERFDAEIVFDPADLAASRAAVTIDVTSVNTASGDRDRQLAAPEWFDFARFATARFETTSIRHLGGDAYEADAVLSLRDRQRDVVLPFTLTIDGDMATMTGTLTLNRVDYDIGQGDWAGDGIVGHPVSVIVDLVAHRGP